MADFISRYQLRYPFLMDRTAEVSITYGVTTTPTTYFVSPGGEIVDVRFGVVSASWLEKNIERYITG